MLQTQAHLLTTLLPTTHSTTTCIPLPPLFTYADISFIAKETPFLFSYPCLLEDYFIQKGSTFEVLGYGRYSST